eukprot:8445670-Lingulodinium_polyedra.AAC.1
MGRLKWPLRVHWCWRHSLGGDNEQLQTTCHCWPSDGPGQAANEVSSGPDYNRKGVGERAHRITRAPAG